MASEKADKTVITTDIWAFQRRMMNRLLRLNTVNFWMGTRWLADRRSFWRGMGAQALAWSAINIAIAYFAQRGIDSKLEQLEAPQADEAQRDQTRSLRRILAINAPLNLVYIASGLALKERGNRDAFQQGNGWGIVLQGFLLLCFDTFHLIRINAIWREKKPS